MEEAKLPEVLPEDGFDAALVDFGEAKESGVDGAAQRRAKDVGDGGVVREGGLESKALVLAVGSESWVAEIGPVGDGADVADGLCMSGEVEADFWCPTVGNDFRKSKSLKQDMVSILLATRLV